MADAYITTAYVDAHIGIDLRQTWFPVATELVTLIEGATGFVQSYLRNSGYSTPSSTTDETVKMAVMGALHITRAVAEVMTQMQQASKNTKS